MSSEIQYWPMPRGVLTLVSAHARTLNPPPLRPPTTSSTSSSEKKREEIHVVFGKKEKEKN